MEGSSVLKNRNEVLYNIPDDSSSCYNYRYYYITYPSVLCPLCGSPYTQPTTTYYFYESKEGTGSNNYSKKEKQQGYICNNCNNYFFIVEPQPKQL